MCKSKPEIALRQILQLCIQMAQTSGIFCYRGIDSTTMFHVLAMLWYKQTATLIKIVQLAISEFMSASSSKRVQMWSFSCEK